MSPVELHHDVAGPGDAPVLVLSGALGATVDMWYPQRDVLAERFRVVRIDHRGHGGSPVPPGPYTMDDLGSDVVALLDVLGCGSVSWCGLSLGGMVGMWLAVHAPQRLDRLVLCSTTARFDDPSPFVERAAAARSAGTASIAGAVVRRWFTPGYAAARPDLVEWARGMVADTPDEGYAACCEAIVGWDHVDRLDGISAPTVVVVGAQDESTPPEPHARRMAGGIPGARLAVLPDAAHLASVEQAEAVNRLLLLHLAAS